MLEVLSKIPSYYFFRAVGRPRLLPMNLTASITYRCNSHCKTCNIQTRSAQELALSEWDSVFASIGKSLFWVTISGGEPFLRRDISSIIRSLYDRCRPSVINIPTNGILSECIASAVEEITNYCADSQLVINVSIDEIGERHDAIRGISGNFEKAIETFSVLKSLALPNLSVGIHTVISKYNVTRIPDIYRYLLLLNPDSYVTEIAEEREELKNVGSDITPAYEEYTRAVDFLSEQLRKERFTRVGRITRAFRLEYYGLVKRILRERRQVIPCYAGVASAQIAPDGDVWMCCITADPIGNVRDTGFDFREVWHSDKADILRRNIKSGKCFCPLANASYTNMLHNARTLTAVGWNLLRNK